MAMGSLARTDAYDPMSGALIGAAEPPPDPREGLPEWAMGALANPRGYEPGVGMWPAYRPPKELPDVGPPAIPSGPTWEGNPTANRAADAMGNLAMTSVLPQDPLDAGLMLATGPGRVGYKIAAGAMGAVLNPDEAEAARWIKYPFNNIAVGDTIENLAKRNAHFKTKDIAEHTIQPHDIPVGSWLTPLVGDRSRSGELVTHIGEKELRDPVWMQGGYQFPPEWKDKGVAWASDRSPVSTIAGRVNNFAGRDIPGVYGVYTPMSPQSIDASHHVSDAISQMMHLEKDKLSKTAIEKFDDRMRKADPEFPGVTSDNLQQYLRRQSMTNRNNFVKTMNTKEAREAGFPDVEQARIALTHPDLIDTPNYAGGHSIASLTGETTHGSRGFGLAPHYTYPSKLHGEYMGGLAEALPQELLWRDLAPKIAARNPSAAGKIWLTGLKGEPFGQQVDRQWQDAAAEYFRRQQRGD
jgi:hypothetical protein